MTSTRLARKRLYENPRIALSDKQLKTIEEWIDERIQDTFIQINESKANCDFANNWVKE